MSILAASVLAVLAISLQTAMPRITEASADAVIDGCRAYADENDLTIAIAVMDDRGELIAFRRMDSLRQGPAELAMKKARYAAVWGSETKGLGDAVADGRMGFALSSGGPPIEGGVPIYSDDGTLIGGAGVSGAPAVEDAKCVRAGIENAGLKDSRS